MKHKQTFTNVNISSNDHQFTYIVELVDSDITYYACFLEEKDNSVYGGIFVGFLIVIIWIFASYGIYYLIKKFKNSKVND